MLSLSPETPLSQPATQAPCHTEPIATCTQFCNQTLPNSNTLSKVWPQHDKPKAHQCPAASRPVGCSPITCLPGSQGATTGDSCLTTRCIHPDDASMYSTSSAVLRVHHHPAAKAQPWTALLRGTPAPQLLASHETSYVINCAVMLCQNSLTLNPRIDTCRGSGSTTSSRCM